MSASQFPDHVKHAVLVVDDHPVFRRGLASLLSVEPWVAKVHESSDENDAVRVATTEEIDVVCMDLRLRDDDIGMSPAGIRAVRRIQRARPQCAILVLTMVMDESLVATALEAGARGYLLKSSSPEHVVEAVRLVSQGGLVLGTGVGPSGLRRPSQDMWPPPLDRLNERQRRLAQLLSEGRSNAAIARALGVSDKTVRNQISALLVLLEVSDRVAAALLWREQVVGHE